MSINELKAKWAAGRTTYGLWNVTGSPFIAETMALDGADYVCVLTHPAGLPLWHEGSESEVETSAERGDERLSLKRVSYSSDADEGQVGSFIEIAHHVGERYRLINLSDEQARELAAALLKAIAAGGKPAV